MKQAGKAGGLPTQKADLEAEGARLFVGKALGDAARSAGGDPQALMKALVESLEATDTFAINAFLEDTPSIRSALQSIREAVHTRRKVATTLDFGPRYLHSTGQLQKGGPNRLAGLQLWQSASARLDKTTGKATGKATGKGKPLAIPGLGGDFDTLVEAQATGDFSVLCDRDRRMIGIDVGGDPAATLSKLATWFEAALA